MQLPMIQGKLDQDGFFVYAAADRAYFDRFGRALARSLTLNTKYGMHFHLYDPTNDQLIWCDQTDRVSVTWEYLLPKQMQSTIDFWSKSNLPEPYASRKNKMLGLKQFADNANLVAWLYKTYYACMRFVRLSEIVTRPRRFLEIDVDGLVRRPFDTVMRDDAHRDFYLYEKEKGGHLAGAILYTDKPQALAFIQDLATVIQKEIERDNVYWFLDQHSLDQVITGYRRGLLPITYVDWRMQPDSAIWSAKGKRKDVNTFVQELKRYS